MRETFVYCEPCLEKLQSANNIAPEKRVREPSEEALGSLDLEIEALFRSKIDQPPEQLSYSSSSRLIVLLGFGLMLGVTGFISALFVL